MHELSNAYHEACNAGNAINRVIEASHCQTDVQKAAQEVREKIVQLNELITETAEFEQAEMLRECKTV